MLEKAFAEPESFVSSLGSATGDLGCRYALLQLRPILELHLPESIEWQELLEQLKGLTPPGSGQKRGSCHHDDDDYYHYFFSIIIVVCFYYIYIYLLLLLLLVLS